MSSDTRIGSTIAGCRIKELIGRGGMGVVYRAEHLRLGRNVALKILSPELAGNQRFRERFIRESRIAASIDHPNIIPIYDADEVDGVLFIAMRYARGTDLRTLIRDEGPLSARRVASLIGQVGDALDAAHAEGLVHRDVKPANVLVVAGSTNAAMDHAYLVDFGLSRQVMSDSGLTATGQLVGTIQYAAPEQFQGKPLGARADLYSLGCVLYECLAGTAPYRRDTEAAVMFAHLTEPPPTVSTVRPDLPAALDAVVSKALAKSPDERYESCREMTAALEAVLFEAGLMEAPHRVRPPGTERAAHRPHRRRSRAMVAIAVTVLAAIGAVVTALVVGEGGTKAVRVRPDSVVRIDPAGNRVAGFSAVGSTDSCGRGWPLHLGRGFRQRHAVAYRLAE
jgi:serine/threonine protein kinase